MRMKYYLSISFSIFLAAFLIFQPALIYAATNTSSTINPNDLSGEANQVVAADTPETSLNNILNTWSDYAWITDAITPGSNKVKGVISLNATDQAALNTCADPTQKSDCHVDSRVVSYLTNLVTPIDQGGAGLTYIKANILKTYDTNGIGKYDRETLDANPEDPSLISAHNTGQAVDISEAGTVTCKLVEKHHLGGDTTHWQPALPVKVAWQSPNGFANNPTPTGSSLVGVSAGMTADSIVNYLNSTGELDASLDYVKGLNLSTMAQYVGANVLLKTLGSTKIQIDPLSGNIISSIGASVLQKQFSGLPSDITADNQNEDLRIVLAKSQIEDSLELPPGSLAGYGWNDLLLNTGKRALEQNLGLPTNYLNTHSLTDLNNDQNQASFSYVKRGDDAFNFIGGTIATLQKNDQKGLKMAAVNILTHAFKLSDDQKTALIKAVNSNSTPTINATGMSTSNQISVDGLKSYLSITSSDQTKAQDELKNLGLSMLQKAVKSAVPSQFTGLTQQVINTILNPGSTISLNDIALSLGTHALVNSSDVDPNQAATLTSNPTSSAAKGLATTVASGLNKTLGLSGNSVLSGSDVTAMFSNNFDSLKKIGGAELDKAFNWSSGTGLKVINDPNAIGDAMKQTFANSVAQLLGINSDNFSLTDKTGQDYGSVIIAERLGLDSSAFKGLPDAATLLTQIGQSKFASLFGIANLNPNSWDNPTLNQSWNETDIGLGLPAGTIRSYLQGIINGQTLAQTTSTQNLSQLTTDQIIDQFGLGGDFKVGNDDLTKVLGSLKTGTVSQVLDIVNKIVGYSVDSKANFSAGDFATFFTSQNDAKRTQALLDMGVKLFGKALGANLSNYSDKQLANIALSIKDAFNGNGGADTLFINNGNVTFLGDFLLKATGIPKEFRNDARSFLSGDYTTGLAGMSFALWQKNINPYLPADGQLTYQEMRNTLGISDPVAIQQEADVLAPQTDSNGNPISTPLTPELRDMARQQLNIQASQAVQYKISDSFLRKIDPTIPAGFSKAMFSGTDQERAAMLEQFAFSNIDSALTKINPAYQPGSLLAVFQGKISTDQLVLTLTNGRGGGLSALQSAVAQSGVTLGPLSAGDLGNLVTYIAAPSSGQNILTDAKFTSTWGNLDRWLSTSIGIGDLPTGLSQSIVLASQHNWDFNASLKDANGNTTVQSINSLGSSFFTNRVSAWADQELKLPVGTVFKTYQAIKAVADASKALSIAEATGNISAFNTATANLSKAQAGLAVLAITTALNVCAACQQLFSTVDQAIAAPPGFTNAAVAGAIAMAFHLGPAGLYIAAAIYLFGAYKVEYLCPKPPVDQFGVTSFDQGNDQLDFGYTPAEGATISSSPAPGQNTFTWGDSVPFTNGKNPKVWEGWARYYTGLVLDATMSYGAAQEQVNKPLQIITYRQANAEFFNPRSVDTFGPIEAGNDRVGLGFTQNSTKTTDWIHASFGGLF